MNSMKLLVWLCLWCLAFTAKSQDYPQGYFRYPMDSLPNYVSPFGGLRDNHFHSGADLRTNGREGLPVYAAADGVVSRIKVQRNGYGRALYLEHPNGYMTVYGHLKSYAGAIENWVHTYQYVNETFEFDKIFIKPFLKVKKGDIIGWSGNSGGSSGPHLHFEIRDIRTEKIINPALFGLAPKDSLSPAVFRVHFYKFVSEGLLLKKQFVPSAKNLLKVGEEYWLKDTMELDAAWYGLGAEVYDYVHNSKDEKGIYSIELYQNELLKFQHTLKQFGFDETKFINAHIDFPYYRLEKKRVQKCFVDDGNRFGTYTSDALKGKLALKEGEVGCLTLVVMDVNANTCRLLLPYKIKKAMADPDYDAYVNSVSGKATIYPGKHQTVSSPEGFEAKLEPGSVYDTVYYSLSSEPAREGCWSKEFKFHQPLTPVHTPFEIAIQAEEVPSELKSKLLLAYAPSRSDVIRAAGGAFDKGWVRGKASAFGNYMVALDTVAPKIKLMRFRNTDDPSDTMRWDFDIRDNFSGISSWEVYLNGRWILTDFDAKNNQLIYRFDEVYEIEKFKVGNEELPPDMPRGFKIFVRVTDAKGNRGERNFFIPTEQALVKEEVLPDPKQTEE